MCSPPCCQAPIHHATGECSILARCHLKPIIKHESPNVELPIYECLTALRYCSVTLLNVMGFEIYKLNFSQLCITTILGTIKLWLVKKRLPQWLKMWWGFRRVVVIEQLLVEHLINHRLCHVIYLPWQVLFSLGTSNIFLNVAVHLKKTAHFKSVQSRPQI